VANLCVLVDHGRSGLECLSKDPVGVGRQLAITAVGSLHRDIVQSTQEGSELSTVIDLFEAMVI
jgi:hypothetical protein